ncbi:MAG: hypothetical protein QOJ79_3648 [Actinomycetota bacterium]|jgi:hypothetical protein|nr:hypothetical protein [Actinomycetota bacterium]
MYRERIHLTVSDMDGWNEAIDAMAEINKIMERLSHPTATVWTDTVGVFNQLVAEIDYVDLASYEAFNKAFYAEPDVLKQLQRLNHATVQGKGYSELLETTSTI